MKKAESDLNVAREAASLRCLVENRLRAAIGNGTFKPGQRLIERELCEQTGVGRTSIREALRQLEAEGLVTTIPHRGPVVSTITVEEARQLYELRALLERFDGCALKATASRLVFSDGNPEARVMLVGEAPGRDEDIEGVPFVGRSGKLLDLMLAAIGLDRSSVYIANVVPWRPPGNRTPTPQETQICLPFITRQIELADPDILVCLGGPSAQTLLGQSGITKIRGRWFPFHSGAREIRAMPTFHPAFLLRSPLQKRFAWRDYLAIKKALGG